MRILTNVPTSDWLIGIALFLGLSILITSTEIFYKRFVLSKENLRKAVHILSGVAILLTPFLFQTYIPLLIISIFFALLNIIAIYTHSLNSYNATERKSLGTFYYPVAVIGLTLLFWEKETAIFLIAFGLLAFSDAIAGFIGQTAPDSSRLNLPWDIKSMRGATAMFISSVIIVSTGIFIYNNEFNLSPVIAIVAILSTAMLATVGELLSYRGSDNLSVPALAAIVLYVFKEPDLHNQFIVGFILALGVVWLAYRLKALDLSGALATFVLGAVIFGYGGWLFTIPILLFFIVSSAISHLPHKNKAKTADTLEAGARRNVEQVFANGIVPFACVIASFFYTNDFLFILYLGALAAATADTWATEIGLLSKSQPRSIINGKKVVPGMSGGITMLGNFGAIAGAAFVTLSGYIVSLYFRESALKIFEIALIVVAGVMAQFIDSMLGALWQRKNRCAVCNKITERTFHCEQKTELFQGKEWLDNNRVNLICGISGLFFINLFILMFD